MIAATFHVRARIPRGDARARDDEDVVVMAPAVSALSRAFLEKATTTRATRRGMAAGHRLEFARVSSRAERLETRERRVSASSSSSASPERVHGRPTCERCRRASRVCVCAPVARALGSRDARIRNRTRVHIMQDRKEFRRALGSAVVCALALERCDVRVLFEDLRVAGDAVSPPKEAFGVRFENLGLLWPSEDAEDLGTYARARKMAAETATRLEEGEEEGEKEKGDEDATKTTKTERHELGGLIVLDTTWHRAKAMYHRIPWLARVPKYRIDPRRKSNYRIRKQPNDACLSTAECVSEALVALEPDIGAERLSLAFDYMIDDQLDAEANAEARGARETVSGAGRRRPSAALARARALADGPSSESA